jgi:hypothetical protein
MALRRLGASDGLLKSLSDQATSLAQEGRAVLARVGLGGIHESGRLDGVLLSIETGFQQAATERRAAFEQLVVRLSAQLSEVLETAPPTLPLYDAGNDEVSCQVLCQAVADTVSRAVAFLQLGVAGVGSSKNEKLARAKLRADIQVVARRAADPAWVLDAQTLEMRREALRALRALRARVGRTMATSGTLDHAEGLHLARVLMSLPAGPIDLHEVFHQAEGIATRTEIIAELVRLMEQGTLHLSIDLTHITSRGSR